MYLENVTVNDYRSLTDDDNYILETDYTCNPYHINRDKTITITYEYINDASIDDLILLINKIFECLNHCVPKKSQFEEHCELASELYSELPQWKKDAMKRDPYIYNPPDPQ